MDNKFKTALLRWRSATINMQRVVHVGNVCMELDQNGYAYKSRDNMTDDDYHRLFVLQQQYLSFTGRATRARAPTVQVENRDNGKSKRNGLVEERANEEEQQKEELLDEQGQDQCKRFPVEHEHTHILRKLFISHTNTHAHTSRASHRIRTFI